MSAGRDAVDVGLPGSWGELLSRAGVPAAVVAPDGRVLMANDALRAALGWSPDADDAANWGRDCIADGDPAAAAFTARGGDGAGTAWPLPARLKDRAGRPGALYRWHGLAVRDERGAASALALVGFDLSSELAAQARLLRLARFYRALSDMSLAMGRLRDADALYRAACEIVVESGQARMAWVGVPEGGRLVPVAWGGGAQAYTEGLRLRVDDDHHQKGPAMQALAGGQPCICNDVAADPRMRPWRERLLGFGVRASGAFPILRGERVAGILNLYFADKDAFDDELLDLAQRLASDLGFALSKIEDEAARDAAERVARSREAQLAGVVGSAMDAIIAIDRQQRVVLFNDAAARMFGVAAREVVGGTLDRFIPAGVRAAHRGFVEGYAGQAANSRHMGFARELTGVRANGEEFPIEASISRSGEGEEMLMTVMVRDATQLRRAEREQAARIAAEAASRAKTEFLSRIGHELRTPLNAILGFSRLMGMDAADPLSARHREQVDLVLQAGEHLRSLIDEMLDVSGIESGRVVVEQRDFELCELLDGVLRMSAPHALECGVRLEAAYAPRCAVLMRSDPGRLRQIVLNLVSNGIKYGRRGGCVRLELERDPYFVHVLVRDDGIGMTAAQQAQLFQPFNRLGREAGTVPGTGIGLVLVRQLVGLLGGELTLHSEVDKGTCVRVTLP
ncbi:MAG TPA: ATP-binding protein, partial [Burkholderiaceae bacterium]